MNFTEKLAKAAEENNSIVCAGFDPDADKIPIKGKPGDVIPKFFSGLLDAFEAEDAKPGIIKPNAAFYEQYGIDGIKAMKKVIDDCKKRGYLVILDAKRADIGNTSKAYAKAVFDTFGVDAVTVAPYMGSDSVQPFIEYSGEGRGVYILNRTSNKGAVDMQDLVVNGKPLYMETAKKIVEWHRPGTGAVVGATYPGELEAISKFFVSSGKKVPLLIPGVGAQGGSASDVVKALKKSGNDIKIHRINSSRGIIFAYLDKKTDDFAGAAAKAVKELNGEINLR
ncbi:MAG TPA: orotidine-5'-phosphate decarboxylase [Candidatus Nanoarchaeia archaeon]|nr:orotidine-5'-phosphate decarboxylase [Candidatus Nanoarchaeia archaeon]